MKIALLGEWLAGMGGSESYLVSLACLMKRAGYSVEVICCSGRTNTRWNNILMENKIPLHSVGLSPRRSLKSGDVACGVNTLFEFLFDQQFDVVHCVPYERTSFLVAQAMCRYSPWRRPLMIGQEPSDASSTIGWWYSRSVLGKFINCFDVIQVHGLRIGQRLKKRFDVQAPIVVCPAFNGNIHALLALPSGSFHTPHSRFKLSYIGRLSREKDPLCAVKAFRQALTQNAELEMHVWGVGVLRSQLLSLVKEEGTRSVYVHGPYRDLEEVLVNTDVAISSSRMEGLGLGILEAMAAGKPIIASRVGAIYDEGDIRRSSWVQWVEPNDAEAMSRRILEFAKMPFEKRAKLGEMARNYINSRYSPLICQEKHEALYQCSNRIGT